MESMNEEKELLEHVMKLMAEHFGKNCEIVLHDFMAPDNHTIIGIENGEVTGRMRYESGLGDPQRKTGGGCIQLCHLC